MKQRIFFAHWIPESGEKVECNEMLISEVTLPKELWDNQEVPVLEFHVDDVRFDFMRDELEQRT